MSLYEVGLVILGLAALAEAVLPSVLRRHHPSFRIFFVAAGFLMRLLPWASGYPGPLAAGVHGATADCTLGTMARRLIQE